MISFKQFLNEYVNEVPGSGQPQFENALEIAVKHCQDALKSTRKIWRGMDEDDPYLELQGDLGERRSRHTSNYYTVILDEVLTGYPKRSASAICTTDINKARQYGDVYWILPYDGVKIGVCPTYDIFYSTVKLGNHFGKKKFYEMNHILDDYDIDDTNFETLVSSMRKNSFPETLGKTKQEVKDLLKRAYSPEEVGFNLITTNELNTLDKGNHEMWIGGQCLAIHYDKVNIFLDALFNYYKT